MHTFHIPVMGLAYTIDSPVKVARFGISSVISIIEDRLIEMMRSHYYPAAGETYRPIPATEPDYRARRITDYLNLVNRIVKEQVEQLRHKAFEAGSEITRYFEMLPEHHVLKQMYRQMTSTADSREKASLASSLRSAIRPGSIDVNIMTKTDKDNYDDNGQPITDGSDAVAALRGYVNSDLTDSSIVFSAGMNPRLYNYLEKCPQFNADAAGNFSKKIIVKVSDFRSALIQGKYLAKKGIWVSEFRIESGLNCGGHAFPSDGTLMGPILEEFKVRRQELVDTLFALYQPALQNKGLPAFAHPPALKISAQGGIGTAAEDQLLHTYYGLDSTGWGTPFLLVPEATTVDADTRQRLCNATPADLTLSYHSPLGARFHYLKGSTAEKERLARIQAGKPGSPCTEKHLSFNTEFTEKPICTASRQYQRLKVAQLQSLQLPEDVYQEQLESVLDKECLCVGLSNAAAIEYEKPFVKGRPTVNICPGPGIAYFNKEVSLQTMTDHIYGRQDILGATERPHMFITELKLYLNYLTEQLEKARRQDTLAQQQKYFRTFSEQLTKGIGYYCQLATTGVLPETLLPELEQARLQLAHIIQRYALA
ncbi:hypothetical protein HF324_16925 [Chitinophaga oryzae]|uniref:Uncharacterized protein n=1 Tax=Chitinophaga oryzae TaxID=2725414 RepID=A0AAE6ZHT2_9BACT|nr:hypothetical protein [Chitinophaga oryzae]QJB32983.1 hypothetical protein HF329_17325 [Chitinophaga oryzae]QJB39450.1 hypothetical protein HF324_16925 [Chitinophaga oryzae]